MSSPAKLGETADSPDVAYGVSEPQASTAVALPRWLISSTVFGVVVFNGSGSILFANETFADFLRCDCVDDLAGQSLKDSYLADDDDWKTWLNRTPGVIRLRDSTGEQSDFNGEITTGADHAGEPLYHCVLCRQSDSIDTRQLFEHAARMEAVAGLSSGVAHDFNNLLTVLVGNLYLLGEELRDNESAFSRIRAARDTALRGSELTKQLLNYARSETSDETEVCPATVVEKLQPLLEKLVGSRIGLSVETTADKQTAAVSRAQLESAIVNLVINARDALDGAGTIQVSVNEREKPVGIGWQIVISVQDDGPGMSASVRERVFEPFFTTKGDGKGTGLGLCMVRWFAESASGAAEIESEPGSGTKVSIVLPEAARETGDTTCSKTIPLSVLPGGDERIALVIDDVEVRAMTQQTLAVLGYDVQRTGIEEIVSESAGADRFDLAVVDALDSRDLVRLVGDLQRNSSVPVLALTAGKLAELDQDIQLRKPFSLVELAGGVRGVLDGDSVSD